MKPRGDAQVIRYGLIYMQELASDKPEPSAKQSQLIVPSLWMIIL